MANGWTGGQFSVVRVVVALYLLVELVRQAAMMRDPVWMSVAAVGAGLCVVLALGWHRWSAGGLWAIATAVGVHMAMSMEPARPSAAVLIGMGAVTLLVIAALPAAPYGSLPAWGRADPGAGWRFPPRLFAAVWVIVAALYLLWAVLLLPDLGWRVIEEGMRLGVFGREMPVVVSVAGNWLLLGAWLAFAPLAIARRTRPIGWGAALLANVLVLPMAGHGELVAPLVMLHLLAFNPAWLPACTEGELEVLFYDGACGLCHRATRFVLAEDPAGACFELSPRQGRYFETIVSEADRAALPDSVVLRQADGTLKVKSSAVVAILDRLGGLWRVAAWLLWVVPRPVRDFGYDLVAAVRVKLFAQPAEACPMVPGYLRGRFRM